MPDAGLTVSRVAGRSPRDKEIIKTACRDFVSQILFLQITRRLLLAGVGDRDEQGCRTPSTQA